MFFDIIQIYINISFLYFKECRENYDNLITIISFNGNNIDRGGISFYCRSEGYRLLSVNDNYRKTIISVFHQVI